MRAVCDGCGLCQSPDWKAGDLCSSCGKAVRRDVRCYWCVKWVPAATFCRSCGATIVEERLFGAARMLKDAGTDRFSIPKQLVEFDPDQIENFSRIYQRHAIAVARHVDEVRFLEGFLRQQAWSAPLEDELIAQLPWPEATLARMSQPSPADGASAADALARVVSIQEGTPFAQTAALAALARLRLRDPTAYDAVVGVFASGDPRMRAEAALLLTTWRIQQGVRQGRELTRDLIAALQASPWKVPAAVGLGLLGHVDEAALREALTTSDHEVAFGAALVLGDLDRLRAALAGDAQERTAAGQALAALGVIAPLAEAIVSSGLAVQRELLAALCRRKEPAPELGETLIRLVETTDDETLRERAVRVLCRGLRPEWAMRIARRAGKDQYIFQSLMSEDAALPADVLAEVLAHMVDNGRFAAHQYGLMETAKRGAVWDAFVPARFAQADAETRKALLSYAEAQLQARGDEALHRFVMGVVFGPHPAQTRAAAWWVLHRWYARQGDRRGEGPFRLTIDSVERFFGSLRAFLPLLASVVGDHATMKEVGVFEFMAAFLGSADDEAIAAIQAEPGATDELVPVLLAAAAQDYWPYTLESITTLVSRIGTHARWRGRVIAGLEAIDRRGNHHHDLALRRLRLSMHGIPEESRWDALPLEFILARFPDADADGKRELLELAEHQLIHAPTGAYTGELLRFLLAIALRPGEPDIRLRALHIHHERSPRSGSFPLATEAIEQGFGPLDAFIGLLPAVLADSALLSDRVMLTFVSTLLDDPEPDDGQLVASTGAAGTALVTALVSVVATKGGDSGFVNLRAKSLRWLAQSGAHPAWRDEVVQGLVSFQADASFDLKGDLANALREIRARSPVPASGPAPSVEPVPQPSAVPPEPENPYAEKYRVAERLGRELQEAMLRLMSGPASTEEKMREGTRLSEEFQARVKALYAG